MARSEIHVGDDLSGKTLFFNFQETGDFQGRSNGDAFTTSGGYVLNYYHAGATGVEELIKITGPNDFYVTVFSNWRWDILENLTEYTLPTDAGTVTAVNTSTGILDKVKWGNPFTSKVYLGNNEISQIYLGTTAIYKANLGENECSIASFIFRDSEFIFERGQTWKDWVDQAKYWTPSDDFSYNENGVYSGEASLYQKPGWGSVSYTDFITEDGEYGAALACLSPDTLIKTDKGLVEISTLLVGDELTEKNIVEKIVAHNREKYYIITLENNDVIKASNDHLFVSGNKIIRTEQLEEGQLLNKLKIKNIELVNEPMTMYEIKTSTNQYTLFNDIICECENI